MKKVLLLSSALAALVASPAASQDHPTPNYEAPLKTPLHMVDLEFAKRMEALRQEGLELQRSEGGTLSSASRARLQAKLDRELAAYRRKFKRNDPWSVNADGSARY